MSAEVPPPVPEGGEEMDEQERQAEFERVVDHVMVRREELFDRLADS